LATIYQRVLGDRFDLLPQSLGRFLSDEHGGRATGRLTVTRSAGYLRGLAAAALGIPPAGDYYLLLEVSPHGAGQRWVRRFGHHRLETTQIDHRGLLVESTGPASLGFQLTIERGALVFRPCRAWVLGIPWPPWLAPSIEAKNWPNESGGWRVRVEFCVPLLGLVGKYEGDVMPEDVA
jgi:hypothetical protein